MYRETQIKLKPGQPKELLKTKLEKKYNKKIILQQVIDSSILGGIYVRVNNEVMDGTVKLRLEELKKLMVSAE